MKHYILFFAVCILGLLSAESVYAVSEYTTFESFYKRSLSSIGPWIIIGSAVVAVVAAAVVFITGGTGGLVVVAIATWIGNLMGYTGAVALNVGLAVLGGGSIAAGGFGMVGGATVLTATLTFSTSVALEYAYEKARTEFDYRRLREQSEDMVTLPPPRSRVGEENYRSAMDVLAGIEDEEPLSSERNYRVISSAIDIAVGANRSAMSLLERARMDSLVALLYFQINDHRLARRYAISSIESARRAGVIYTVPSFIVAVNFLYDETFDHGAIIYFLRYAILNESNNRLVPLLFSIYMDRLALRLSDDDLPSEYFHQVYLIMADPAIESHRLVNYQALLTRYFIYLKLNQQKISSVGLSINETIRGSPRTLQVVDGAIAEYRELLLSARELMQELIFLPEARKTKHSSELKSQSELLLKYEEDFERLQRLRDDLEVEQAIAAERRLRCVDWNADQYFRSASVEEVICCLSHLSKSAGNDEYSPERLFHAASMSPHASVVLALISAGMDPNSTTVNGLSPLHAAAWSNPVKEVVRVLIGSGAYVHAPDTNGNTPLHAAAYNNTFEVVTTLLNAGAGVMMSNADGLTPLHAAALNAKDFRVIAALVDWGADIEARDALGRTSLLRAVTNNDGDIVTALIEVGANVNSVDRDGNTALHHGILGNREVPLILKLLGAGSDVNAQNERGKTPLHLEIEGRNDSMMVRALIDSGADLAVQDDEGKTALHLAVVGGDATVVHILLTDDTPDVYVVDIEGNTPLHIAAHCRDDGATVASLLAASATVGVQNDFGDAPLHIAATSNSHSCVELLLNAGANVELRNKYGYTALHQAALSSDEALVISVLVDAGAFVDAEDEEGNTPLHLAAFRGDQSTVLALISRGANVVAANEQNMKSLDVARMFHAESPVVATLMRAHPTGLND